MSLVWHIVRKDFRRLAGPLALWLALLLGHVWLLFVWEGQMGTNPAAFEGKRYFVNTCDAIVAGVGFILAAWLVMEDSLVSTQAFWRTRAISGARLLAAKALGSVLMFSVLPAVVLAPVWLGCGFSMRELAYAGWELGATQAYFSLAAFALGSVSETSRQFLIRLVTGGIVLVVSLVFDWVAISLDPSLNLGRWVWPTMLIVVTPLAMTFHQFLTRRTGRTWILFLGGIGLSVGLTRWWPQGRWEADLSTVPAQPGATRHTVVGDRLTYEPTLVRGYGLPLKLEGRVTDLGGNQYVRVDRVQTAWVSRTGSRPGPRLEGAGVDAPPAPEVTQAIVQQATASSSGNWTAVGVESSKVVTEAGEKSWRLQGWLQATVLKGEVLGEISLQAGAELRQGSSFLRVKAIRTVDDKLRVLIEEREAWLTADVGAYSHSYDLSSRHIRPAPDGFVVLNRGKVHAQLPVCEEIGTMQVDSILVGRRELVLTPPADAEDWLQGAVLVKVRFRPAEKIVQALAEPVALTR